MKRVGWLISKYVLTTILPYFVFAWVLLSAILFLQQAGKFADIFFDLNVPVGFVWQLAAALIPNVISFTCPMAALVATIIGMSKLRVDSELVAMRAAGVGSLQLAVPVLLLGVVLSAFAFFVNIKGVPFAAAMVRNVVLQAAIKKLESPIEPGVFNTDIAGYTIYVREGDREAGLWRNVLIFREDAGKNSPNLITAATGRLDFTDQATELVFSDAHAVTLPKADGEPLVYEDLGEIRIATNTRRSELVERLTKSERIPDELGLRELSQFTSTLEGKERIEAELVFQRRISLSLAPLLFCILGFAISLRFSRGGRGTGSLLALATLLGYYLISFGGEQLARTGWLPATTTGVIPALAAIGVALWFWLTSQFSNHRSSLFDLGSLFQRSPKSDDRIQVRNRVMDLTTGIRDLDLVVTLFRFFALSVVFLAILFQIFTAFELWKFVGNSEGGIWLLAKYLVYLLPYVYLQLAPTAVLIALVATLVTKSRQHEFVTWAAAGQSAYRALLPCLLFAFAVGLVSFGIQEGIAPTTNRLQDTLRTQIRSGGTSQTGKGRTWATGNGRIYSFKVGSTATPRPVGIGNVTSDNDTRIEAHSVNDRKGTFVYSSASDNETVNGVEFVGSNSALGGGKSDRWYSDYKVNEIVGSNARSTAMPAVAGIGAVSAVISAGEPLLAQYDKSSASDNETGAAPCSFCPTDLIVYEFDETGRRLQTVYRSPLAKFEAGRVTLSGKVEVISLNGRSPGNSSSYEFAESIDPFIEAIGKPSHLNISDLGKQLRETEADSEKNALGVTYQKRLSTMLLPLVIALFAGPLTLSVRGKQNISHIAYAVGCWMLLIGSMSVFSQFGDSGQLDPITAVWAPLAIMALVGGYLFSRMRT